MEELEKEGCISRNWKLIGKREKMVLIAKIYIISLLSLFMSYNITFFLIYYLAVKKCKSLQCDERYTILYFIILEYSTDFHYIPLKNSLIHKG